MKTLSLRDKDKVYDVFLDDEDYDYLVCNGGWFVQHGKTSTYVRGNLDGYIQQMHRVIFARYCPLTKQDRVDHIDRNGLNNQRSNLRLATIQQNNQNRAKHMKSAASRYKGVTLGYKGAWKAAIKTDGKTHIIKSAFPTERMAAIAYDTRARELFGEFAYLNIPDAPIEEVQEVIRFIDAWTYRGKTSKYRGVCRISRTGKWQVSFWIRGKVLGFGRYDTEKEAALVYNQEALKVLGEKAKLNIIES